MHGYFNCSRGVHQDDPLSPFLFFLAEEVLNKKLLHLAFDSSLDPIVGPKKVKVPLHILYIDDILIFYKREMFQHP